jgi:flagellar basal-body rod modification protein FlgD
MDVSSTTSAAATATTSGAESKLIGDYDSFLKLLTTQLQYQDPLAPMDATQFVAQLSQFATVEQAIVTNQKLDSVISGLSSSAIAADIGLIGRKVEVAGQDFELKDGTASFSYGLDKDAAMAVVAIRDASGAIVRTIQVEPAAGEHTITWDGLDNSGNEVEDGTYSLDLAAADSKGTPITGATYVTAGVARVEIGADGAVLVLSNGERITSADVRAVIGA